MRSDSLWVIIFYIFIGDTFASAIKHGSNGLLILAIFGMLLGVTWLYPIFRPEEKRDTKL